MKRAEISISMLVGLIVVVLTLGAIVIVYSQINWKGDIDREVCKESALVRGTMPDGLTGSLAADLFSLKCKTKKVCVTTKMFGDGKCEGVFGGVEDNYITYRISTNPEKAKDQMRTILAREMADCWEMLGRGNLDIFKRAMTTQTTIAGVAVICSRVHFDETITGKESLNMQNLDGFNNYLLRHKVPNYEISYLDYLRNAYDGDTVRVLYGNNIDIDKLDQGGINISKTQGIVYVEASPTTQGAIVGAWVGGTVGGMIAVVTAKWGGLRWAGTLIAGGASAGALTGNKLQMEDLKRKELFGEGSETSSAIYMVDYDKDGFKIFSDAAKKVNAANSFEIASLSD